MGLWDSGLRCEGSGVCGRSLMHHLGVSGKKGVSNLRVLIIRILLFWGTILGSPIFGNTHMVLGSPGCVVQGVRV